MIQPLRRGDHRGFFARLFCAAEFRERGIEFPVCQSNVSFTEKKGTIRGMHFQVDGAEEQKLVTCLRGSILDVIIDLRRDSSTFGQYFQVELSETNGRLMYVPRGFAHGFVTLQAACTMTYLCSHPYDPVRERGVRWNDPFFHIDWPVQDPILSDKDAGYADFVP